MSNIINIVHTIKMIDAEKSNSHEDIIHINNEYHRPHQTHIDLFEIKYEGKYVDFYPYKSSYVKNTIPISIYDNIPEKVFGKLIIKQSSITLYKTVDKKDIRIKQK